jgi:hypothetical protein
MCFPFESQLVNQLWVEILTINLSLKWLKWFHLLYHLACAAREMILLAGGMKILINMLADITFSVSMNLAIKTLQVNFPEKDYLEAKI